MPMYSVTLNGRHSGQAVKNILWYRTDALTSIGDLALDYGSALGAAVIAQIWAGILMPSAPLLPLTGLYKCLPDTYTLDSVAVKGYGDDTLLLYSDDVIIPSGGVGDLSGNTNGPATCAILTATLAPALGPGLLLPQKGYFAFGPLLDTDVQSDMTLTTTSRALWQEFAPRLSKAVNTLSPLGGFVPIRVRITRSPKIGTLPTIITAITYKDISSVQVRSLTSFRRSRVPRVAG